MKKVLYFLCLGTLTILLVGCGTNSLKLGSKSNYEIDNGTVRLKINNESI